MYDIDDVIERLDDSNRILERIVDAIQSLEQEIRLNAPDGNDFGALEHAVTMIGIDVSSIADAVTG